MAAAATVPSTLVRTAPVSISAGRKREDEAAAGSTSRAATARVSQKSKGASAPPPENECAREMEAAASQNPVTAAAWSSVEALRSSSRRSGEAAIAQRAAVSGMTRHESSPVQSALHAPRTGTAGG
jgi:hypothetical protein